MTEVLYLLGVTLLLIAGLALTGWLFPVPRTKREIVASFTLSIEHFQAGLSQLHQVATEAAAAFEEFANAWDRGRR